MKLKRCPNMHYYDEDKYPQCPHCAATQQPAPAPAPAPAPVPAPAPIPAPTPIPVPPPEPSPASAPDNGMWRCQCGTVNGGKFCVQCGTPRPVPQPAPAADGSWTCSCGAVNDGRFCCQCGSPKPEAQAAPVSEPAPAPAPEPIPEPVLEPAPSPVPEPDEEPSLTAVIEEVSFTGNIEDAKEKAAANNDDEGVTQIIFDELADDLVLGWLVAGNTEIKGKVFTVTDTKVTIGRSDPEHPVIIDLHGDRAVSRGAQAMMVYDPLNKKFFIQSAGGKTPVYVNRNMLLAPTELAPYDRIMLGGTELVFVPLCNEKFSW